jgi:hypothetical protein
MGEQSIGARDATTGLHARTVSRGQLVSRYEFTITSL